MAKTSAASTPSPKSAPKPKRKRGRGRPPGDGFKPTPEQSNMVEAMAGLGIPEDRQVIIIINPRTKRPISPVTLRKHFRLQLDTGMLKADIKAGQNLLRLTGTSAACAIFWAKVRLHMKETAEIEIPLEPPAGEEGEPDVTELARRIAFTLVLAGRQGKPSKPKAARDK